METRHFFGYVSTPSLKSTLIINELYSSPWPRPDGSPVAIAENTYGNLVTLHGNAYRSSVTFHGDACGGLMETPKTLAPENRYSAWR